MIDYYMKSKKAFKEYIKKNPLATREEWDKYAHENCLFSAFTIECHEISNSTLQKLNEQDKDTFEFLKEIFFIIPPKEIGFLKRIINFNKIKENQEE